MKLFRGLCAPNAVQQQVVPLSSKKYKAVDLELDEQFSSSALVLGSVKVKPSESDGSERSRLRKLEEDIFLLTLDLRVIQTPLRDFERQLLRHESAGPLLYDMDRMSGNAASELVTILRRTVDLHRQRQVPTTQAPRSIKGDTIRALSQLLRDYQEFPTGAYPLSAYNNNCFTSLRHALIITDLLLTSCYDCVSTSSSPQQTLALLAALAELVQCALNLCGFASGDTSQGLAWPMGQIAFKSALLFRLFARTFSTHLVVESSLKVSKSIADLVTLAQTVATAIQTARQVCGEEALTVYLATLTFWEACDMLLYLFVSSSIDENLRPMARLWTNKVLSAYATCVPQVAQILFEVKRLETMDVALYGHSEDAQLTQTLLQTLRENASLSLLGALAPNVSQSNEIVGGRRSIAAQADEAIAFENMIDARSRLAFSLHSRFLLVGMLRMMHMPHFHLTQPQALPFTSAPKLVFPDREKWFCSLYEVLTYLLRDPASATFVLAPFIAHLLAKIAFSLDHDPALDWVYVSFARSLTRFNRTLRLGNFFTGPAGAIAATTTDPPLHSISSASDDLRFEVDSESRTPKRNVTAKGNVPHFDIMMDTPFKGLSGRSDPDSVPFSVPAAAYKVDDKVSALFTVQNGTRRWFPATITAADLDGDVWHYGLLFDDGDILEKQVEADIKPLRRGPRAAIADVSATTPTPLPEHATVLPPLRLQVPLPSMAARSPVPALSPLMSTPQSMLSPQNSVSGSVGGSVATGELARLVSLQQIPQVDADEDADDDEDDADSTEDRVYEIPSIFDGYHRTASKPPREDMVPRMHFGNLPLSSSLPHSASGQSLSGALLRESPDPFPEWEPSPSSSQQQLMHQPKHSARTPLFLTHRSGPHISARAGAGSVAGSEFEDSTASLESLAKPPRPQPPPIHNFSLNFNLVAGEESLNTSQTRLASFRSGEDHGFSNTSRMQQRPPAGGPDATIIRSQHAVVRGHTSSRDQTHRGLGSEDVTPIQSLEGLGLSSYTPQTFELLLQTHALLACAVLRRCFGAADRLDPQCTGAEAGAVAEDSAHLVFALRDFLDVCGDPQLRQCIAAVSTQFHQADDMLRFVKLLHPAYFSNCLLDHMATAQRVGDGGFGSVYVVTCPQECGRFQSLSHCYACFKRSGGRRSSLPSHFSQKKPSAAASSPTSPVSSSSAHGAQDPSASAVHSDLCNRRFAVKRITRERSMYDPPVLQSLYMEVTALDRLRNLIGVCGLEDCGVAGGEYWLVMEAGGMSLADWRRRRVQPSSLRSPLPKHADSSFRTAAHATTYADPPASATGAGRADTESVLARSDVALALLLFVDLAITVRDVHALDVAHFDIKMANIVLREAPEHCIDRICASVAQGQASGVQFLADFGEALPDVSRASDSIRRRSRGTMYIQAPEMLRISESAVGVAESKGSVAFADGGRAMGTRRSLHLGGSGSGSASPMPCSPITSSKCPTFPLPERGADVWALGCLLFELLHGAPVFAEQPWPALYAKLCLCPDDTLLLDDLHALDPRLARLSGAERGALMDVIATAMQRNPVQRCSADALAQLAWRVLQQHFLADLELVGDRGPVLRALSTAQESVGLLSYSRSDDDLGRSSATGSYSIAAQEERQTDAAVVAVPHAEEAFLVARPVLSIGGGVWLALRSTLGPLLAPSLPLLRELGGGPCGLDEEPLSAQGPPPLQAFLRPTCGGRGSLSQDEGAAINAHAFAGCLQLDEALSQARGVAALPGDCLADLIALTTLAASRQPPNQPALIIAHVGAAWGGAEAEGVDASGRVVVAHVNATATAIAAARQALTASVQAALPTCPPLCIVSLEESAAAPGCVTPRVFTCAVALAAALAASRGPDPALRFAGRMHRAMPWTDPLLDLELLQQLLLATPTNEATGCG